jgi:hypothetical protein
MIRARAAETMFTVGPVGPGVEREVKPLAADAEIHDGKCPVEEKWNPRSRADVAFDCHDSRSHRAGHKGQDSKPRRHSDETDAKRCEEPEGAQRRQGKAHVEDRVSAALGAQ